MKKMRAGWKNAIQCESSLTRASFAHQLKISLYLSNIWKWKRKWANEAAKKIKIKTEEKNLQKASKWVKNIKMVLRNWIIWVKALLTIREIDK